MVIDSPVVSGSLISNGNVTITGSLTVTGPINGALTGSVNSSSFAATASSADNFTVRGTLTAQTIVVQTITSSTDFVTGSTRFGSSLSNTHQFTGSVSVTGSARIDGVLQTFVGGEGGNVVITNRDTRPLSFSGSDAFDNVIVGNQNTTRTITGKGSVLVGPNAGASITSGGGNVAIGQSSINNVTTGVMNVGIGFAAGFPWASGGQHSTLGDINGKLVIGTQFGTPIFGDFVTRQVIINGSNANIPTINSSVQFGIESTTRGFLPPVMTSTQRNAIGTPATGLIVYNSTDNYLSLYNGTNWQNVVSPNSSGNVGIGTTSPSERLTVANTGEAIIRVQDLDGTNQFLNIGHNGGDSYFLSRNGSSNGNFIWYTFDGTTTSERMRITSGGNVGIGTTSPTYRLNISGNSNALRVDATNSATDVLASFAGRGVIGVDAPGVPNGRFIITDAGNVGIGTTSPSSLLHINSATAGASILRIENTSGTFETTTAFLQLQFKALRGATTTDRASIVVGRQAIGGSDADAFMAFYTNNGGGNNERMRLDASGNLGLGVTPSAWGSGFSVIEGAYAGNFSFDLNLPITRTISNAFNNGTNWIYKINARAALYDVDGWNGRHVWFTAPSGTAGNAITFTQAMTLDASGRLLIGATSSVGVDKVRVNNDGAAAYSTVNITNANSAANMYVGVGGNSVANVPLRDNAYVWNAANTGLAFGTNDLARMFITSGGNVGIGTTSPESLLHIANGNAGGIVSLFIDNNINALNSAAQIKFTVDAGGSLTSGGAAIRALNVDPNFAATDLLFLTSGGGLSEKMRLTSNGNIGIGTTSPGARLEVVSSTGAAAFGNGINIVTNPGTYTTGHGGILQFQNEDVITAGIRGVRDPGSWASSLLFYTHTSGVGNTFNTTFTEKMRITDSGNVGIGTTSPYAGTNVTSLTINATAYPVLALYVGGTYEGGFIGYSDHVTINSATNNFISLETNDSERIRITAGGNVGIGTTSPSERLEINGSIRLNDGNVDGPQLKLASANYSDWNIDNFTGNLRAYYGSTEYLRLTSVGELLIGKTAKDYTTVGFQVEDNGRVMGVTKNTAGENIFVNRTGSSTGNFILFYFNSGGIGSISTNGSSTSYNTNSDYRLKTDLKDFAGVDLVNLIKVYDYEWKSDKTRSYGVLAHELQSVLPYAVTGEKDGDDMQGVDYSKLVPVLIKAIQELKAEIDQLKSAK